MQLNNITVLDLTRLLPGPYATQLLRDMGAEVIKVEDPDVGDYARSATKGPSLFEAINRGKKSIALDLKTDAGREAFFRLAEDADVVFEQFRPGVVEKLGVEYEAVERRNPEIVYCSLTGYGQEGPYADRVGHDLNYIGMAGLLDVTRDGPTEKPRIPGYTIADMAGGLFAAFTILGGILSRDATGEGEYIDISMTDAVLSFSQILAFEVFAGERPQPGETPHTGLNPWYNVYETADGEYVTLAANEPKFWRVFCETIGREDLIEFHRDRQPIADEEVRNELEAELREIFATKTQSEWEDELGDADTMFGVVNSLPEALEHPQIEARGIIRRPDDAPPRIGFPAISSEGFPNYDTTVPGHGENTEVVLSSQGFTGEEIASLRDRGAFGNLE